MAADAYLRTAAAQLEQAAVAVKQSADQARAELMTFKQQADHDINNKTAEVGVRQVEAERNKNDQSAAGRAMNLVVQLQREIDDTKRELADRTAQVDQLVRSKEATAQGLQSQARAPMSQAGDPNLA